MNILNDKSININMKIEAICTSETWKIQTAKEVKSQIAWMVVKLINIVGNRKIFL